MTDAAYAACEALFTDYPGAARGTCKAGPEMSVTVSGPIAAATGSPVILLVQVDTDEGRTYLACHPAGRVALVITWDNGVSDDIARELAAASPSPLAARS